MNSFDILRTLAEAAIAAKEDVTPYGYHDYLHALADACTPERVLALLDELEAARKILLAFVEEQGWMPALRYGLYACPICLGLMPKQDFGDLLRHGEVEGHRKDCPVLLAEEWLQDYLE